MTPFRTVFLFSFLALISLATLPYLPVNFIPVAEQNSFRIQFQYPNLPPLVVEQEATAPLENLLSQLNGLSSISSVSNYGSGSITLEFLPGTDMAYQELLLHGLLRQARGQLSDRLTHLSLHRSATEETERKRLLTYEFLFPSEASLNAQQWVEHQLIPSFNRFSGIEEVALSGIKRYAWEVRFDPGRLERLGITPAQLRTQLAEAFGTESLGMVTSGSEQLSLRFQSTFSQSF
jgi:multidrug efflux pump subunit AcrB